MSYDAVIFTDGNVRHWQMRPLGAQRVATELRKHGYTVKVVDFFSKWIEDEEQFHQLIDLLVDETTLFVGFSGTFFNKINDVELFKNVKSFRDYYRTQELSVWPRNDEEINSIFTKIRERHPNLKFVYGGDRFDNKIKYLESMMDYIVQGYAENTVIDLANHLRNGTKLQYTLTGNRAKLISHDMDAVGFDITNHCVTNYLEQDHITYGDSLSLETSRGCMFKCTFCAYPILGRRKNDLSYHKSENLLADELRNNYEQHGVRKYIFVDNIFNETTSKLETMLRVRDKSKVDIGFAAFIRYELLNRYPEQLPLLKELGIEAFNIGIESLHLPSAKLTGKGTDPEKVKDIMYRIKDHFNNRVNISGSFIIGLPEDNPDTLNTWLPWLSDMNCPIDGIFMHRMDLHFLGNMDMNQNPSKYGYTNLAVKNGYGYWKNKYWSSIEADRYMVQFLEKCWQSGRTRINGLSFIGLQSTGLTFDELLTTPMRDLDYNKLTNHTHNKWLNYRSTLLNYEKVDK